MPPEEKMWKLTETQKITNRYQDVINNEVKFRQTWNTEITNKKDISITKRTDKHHYSTRSGDSR